MDTCNFTPHAINDVITYPCWNLRQSVLEWMDYHWLTRLLVTNFSKSESDHSDFRSRAKYFRGKQNIYLHIMSFLHIDMVQVRHVRQKLTYSTCSISWILMSWRYKQPGHQQPWYWLRWTKSTRLPHVRGVNRFENAVCIQGQLFRPECGNTCVFSCSGCKAVESCRTVLINDWPCLSVYLSIYG